MNSDARFVITIGRTLASGGGAIGRLLSERLSIRLYDRQLLTLAARQSGLAPSCFEQADEQHSHRWLSTLVGYLRAPFTGASGHVDNVLSEDALFQIQSDVIRDIAERESALFVGRCADYVLRDHPHRLSLFVTADRDDRIARICASEGVSPDEAAARIDRIDARRAAYYNYYSSRTWGEASTYDLCINTSRLGVEATAEYLLGFAEQLLQTKR